MMEPQRLPVAILVERRDAISRWTAFVWRPVAVLAGLPDAEPWTCLSDDRGVTTFYAGASHIELHRSETENYRDNLRSAMPSLWVELLGREGDPPYEVGTVTADPAEGEGLVAGSGIVEAVPMPALVRDTVAAFVARHHVERTFEKRKRDRVDPEALARPNPRGRAGPHGRSDANSLMPQRRCTNKSVGARIDASRLTQVKEAAVDPIDSPSVAQ